MMRRDEIAAVIERDLLRVDDGKPNDAIVCFSCGRGMTYRGSRFCSKRCRDWYDTGNPGYPQLRLQSHRASDRTTGNIPMKPTRDGFKIRCAHCRVEFESRGLRCCSAECEAKLKKPVADRGRRRPKKIPYYVVKVSGHGHWQPSQALRALGFASVDLGFDGPEAWKEADRLSGAARQVRKAA
jgi:hypothetical protein